MDPKGVGRIPLDKLEALIRSLPAPLGVPYAERGSKDNDKQARSFRRLRAKAHYLRQRPGFGGTFAEVLNGIVALWLLEVDKIRMPGAVEQVELFEASILITIRARAWCERRKKRLAAEAVAKAAAEAGSGPATPPVTIGGAAGADPLKADSLKSAARFLGAKGKTPSSRLALPSRFAQSTTKVAPSPLSSTGAAMNSTGFSSSLLGDPSSSLSSSVDSSSATALSSREGASVPAEQSFEEGAEGAAAGSSGQAKGSKNRENLPPGWTKSYTSVYDTKFYYHAPTRTSSWEPPAKTQAKAAASSSSLEAADETKNGESSL